MRLLPTALILLSTTYLAASRPLQQPSAHLSHPRTLLPHPLASRAQPNSHIAPIYSTQELQSIYGRLLTAIRHDSQNVVLEAELNDAWLAAWATIAKATRGAGPEAVTTDELAEEVAESLGRLKSALANSHAANTHLNAILDSLLLA
ncbi:MAG: hypothetical protein M1829_006200 [Trizodia sp. TS-e1964]|nr:MAG: hypothetical protein M1829_006200 [Trizodia sp. TS-e1964]